MTIEDLVARECIPAVVFTSKSERATLPVWSPTPWLGRYFPRGIMATFRGGVNTSVPGALDLASVVVRDASTLEQLTRDEYVVDPQFGSMCLPEGSSTSREVVLSYRFSHLRLDSVVAIDGTLSYERGVSALTTPHAASPEAVARVFVPYFGDASTAEVWPVTMQRVDAAPDIDETPGSLRLVFVGDSVTQGAESTSEQTTYREVCLRALRERFPARTFSAVTAAVGGSNSSDWLGDDPTWDWGIVERSGADLAVIEFVNDAGLDPSTWQANYDELRRRLAGLDCDVLLTTPPFTMPDMMGDDARTARDERPYVHFLRQYADANGMALADVSRGWEGLRDRGIPYWTLLANGINHPDDRGHELAGHIVAEAIARLIG